MKSFALAPALFQKLAVAFGGAILLLAAVSFLAIKATRSAAAANRWLAHSQAVLLRLEECESAFGEVRLAAHGFLVTGDAGRREQYRNARLQQANAMTELRAVIQGNSLAPHDLALVSQRLEERLAALDDGVARRERGAWTATEAGERDLRERVEAQEVRSQFAALKAQERRLLEQREQASAAHTSRVMGLVVAGSLAAIVLVAAALAVLLREMRARAGKERELRSSEAKYRSLANAVPAMIWVCGPDGRHDFFNQPWLAFSGRTLEQEQGSGWAEGIHPDDAGRALEVYRSAFSARRSFELEYRLRRADGQYRWVVDTGVPRFDADGEFAGFIGSCLDITARKLTEQARQQLAAIVDSSDDAIVSKTLDGVILSWNPAAERMYGYTAEEIVGQPVSRLAPPGGEKEIKGLLDRAGRGECTLHLETQRRRKDGHLFLVSLTVSPLRDERGVIIGCSVIARDITERKTAEAATKAMAGRLQRVFDASPLPMAIGTLAEGRLLEVNKSFTTMTGYERHEAIHRTVLELNLWETPDFRARLLDQFNSQGGIRNLEVKCRTRTGELRDCLLFADGIEMDGVACLVTIISDITEKKQLEAQFLRAQRMEGIGSLAAGVAHDLNNILAPILMSTSLLKSGLSRGEDLETLALVETCATRGADIIKQLLMFGRGVEGERIVLQPWPLVNEMAKMLRETFSRNIAVSSHKPSELWPVRADPTQLHQVLLNLCVNARDAMPDGGALKLSAQNIEVDAAYARGHPEAKSGPHVLLQVADSGTGIPPELVSRIFDPFFTTKRLGHGTGLGLATVLSIVKSHGGFINVYSEVGKGTTFRIYLPAAPQETASPSAVPSGPPPRGNGECILLVDDEPCISEVTQANLEGHGYRVVTAANGLEALRVWEQHRAAVRLVLTDIMMPQMSGVALIQALRQHGSTLPVIASSGLWDSHSEVEKFAELRRLGVTKFLSKPYGSQILLHAVTDSLNSVAGPVSSAANPPLPA